MNKGEAERCKDLAKDFMRKGHYAKAVKFFEKSLKLYPLPGVEAMIGRCKREEAEQRNGSQSSSRRESSGSASASHRASSSSSASATSDSGGRACTPEQAEIVSRVRKASKLRDAHYKVLGVDKGADDSQLKKAYRKISLKVHPDKNPAPGSDEAFKAVGLAYATLSDKRKREIYDSTGDIDPDNTGAASNPFSRHSSGMNGDIDPEDIFRMFFGGGMGGMGGAGFGGPGVRVYSTGFGGGGFPRASRARSEGHDTQRGGARQDNPFGALAQLLPILFFLFMSLTSFTEDSAPSGVGGSQYFSLTHSHPFTNPMRTRHRGVVKDIPYFVSDKFMRTYYRDPYKLSQVERMVERSYDTFLQNECRNQRKHKRQLEQRAYSYKGDEATKDDLVDEARRYELTRCDEYRDIFQYKGR